MRKGQIEILNKAKGFPCSQIEILKKEEYTNKQLKDLYVLFDEVNSVEGDYSELLEMAAERPEKARFMATCLSCMLDVETIKALVEMPGNKAYLFRNMLYKGKTMAECEELSQYIEKNRPEYYQDFELLYMSPLMKTLAVNNGEVIANKEIVKWDKVLHHNASWSVRRDMEAAMSMGLTVKEYYKLHKENANATNLSSVIVAYKQSKNAPHLFEIRQRVFDRSFLKKQATMTEKIYDAVGMKVDVVIKIPYSERHVSFGKNSVTAWFKNFSGFHTLGKTEKPSRTDNVVVFYDDMHIFREKGKSGNKKLIPLSLKDMHYLINQYGTVAKEFFIAYLKDIDNQYIAKDLIREIRDKSLLPLPPIPINEAIKYYSIPALMKGYYKSSEGVSFKKMGIRRGYFFMKSRGYLSPTSVSILNDILFDDKLTMKHLKNCESLKHGHLGRNMQYLIKEFFVSVIIQKLENISRLFREDVEDIVSDYVFIMAREKNVSLKHTSIRKLIDEHVEVELRQDSYNTPIIAIPKNSKFKELRKKLPKEFEWIKTRKRIIEEGRRMRHCVASYADYVNKDVCAIYHFEYDQVPYTVEFRLNSKGYYINQIQTVADRGYDKKAKQYIEKLIA